MVLVQPSVMGVGGYSIRPAWWSVVCGQARMVHSSKMNPIDRKHLKEVDVKNTVTYARSHLPKRMNESPSHRQAHLELPDNFWLMLRSLSWDLQLCSKHRRIDTSCKHLQPEGKPLRVELLGSQLCFEETTIVLPFAF